ncbi:metalloregulator ArsR/SmtB family transcription factor [Patescibacteria group bacterium]|nr:metalloregulator ArsR/SmtB family transcription factor [Patescibacteria group bacterium]MBU1123796.1 metalloregulator ArsR/SmtB family transcription factor [Patescibacteria group bacterium]MBU1910995.1 metalloregulator ArsR/SmtB family transcription factor [Patescibacteria group bacterium]
MNDVQKLERQLKAMANERRLLIIKELKKKSNMSVSELADALGTSIFPMSQHLRILRAAEIVIYKRRGRHVTYRLLLPQQQPIKQIIAQL